MAYKRTNGSNAGHERHMAMSLMGNHVAERFDGASAQCLRLGQKCTFGGAKLMSALGQKRTYAAQQPVSALGQKRTSAWRRVRRSYSPAWSERRHSIFSFACVNCA